MKRLLIAGALILSATVAAAQDAREQMQAEIVVVLQAQQVDAATAGVVAVCVMQQMSDDQVTRFISAPNDATKTAILDELADPPALNACVLENI